MCNYSNDFFSFWLWWTRRQRAMTQVESQHGALLCSALQTDPECLAPVSAPLLFPAKIKLIMLHALCFFFFSFVFFFCFFVDVSKWWKTLPCIKLRAKRGAGCVQCFVLTRVSCLRISLKSHPDYAHITFLCIYPFCCDLCLSSLFISSRWWCTFMS